MRFMGMVGVVGSLFLFPNFGAAEEAIWHSSQPVWKASSDVVWTSAASDTSNLSRWAETTMTIWTSSVHTTALGNWETGKPTWAGVSLPEKIEPMPRLLPEPAASIALPGR